MKECALQRTRNESVKMNRSDAEIFQNLLDAGYTRKQAESFMDYIKTDNPEAGRKDLMAHRAALVTRIHKGNLQLHCLDYLLDTL